MYNSVYRILIILVIAIYTSSAHADTYKCTNEQGIAISSDYPCGKNSQIRNNHFQLKKKVTLPGTLLKKPGKRKTSLHNLIKILNNKNEDIQDRTQSAIALGLMGGNKIKKALNPLINALKDKNKDLRASAALALGMLNMHKWPEVQRTVPPLVRALKDEYNLVRGTAAMALGWAGNDNAIPGLMIASDDKDSEVSMLAALSLAKFETPKAIKKALPILIKGLESENYTGRAKQALMKIGTQDAIEALKHFSEKTPDGGQERLKDWLKGVIDIRRYLTIDGKGISLRGQAVTDNDLTQLKDDVFNKVEKLSLLDTQITDAGLFHIRVLPLKTLVLSKTQISDLGLIHLRGLSLEQLFLMETKITDSGLAYLKGLPLRLLDIRNTKITGAGLSHLKSLPLRMLVISHEQITEEGMSDLKAALPSLEIRHLENY